LIVVVILIALITTSALTFALLMQQSNQTARHYADQQQSQWAMDSAVAQLESFASLPRQQRETKASGRLVSGFVRSIEMRPVSEASGPMVGFGTNVEDSISSQAGDDGMPAVEWEDSLGDQAINFDPTQPGFVIFDWTIGADDQASGNSGSRSTFAPSVSASADVAIRFGWTNESSKLHLARVLQWEAAGTPAHELLQAACGLNAEQADRLLDWIDSDDQPREFGAEASDYAQIGRRYRPANQVPDALETILLVPGFSPRLLFGQRESSTIWSDAELTDDDANDDLSEFTRDQKAQIDRDLRSQVDSSLAAEDRDVWLELGLAQRLTTTAKERHQNREGQLKLPVNHADLQELFAAVSSRLEPNLATYLCLARQFGVREDATNPVDSSLPELSLNEVELDFSKPATTTLVSLVQLIDSHVQVPQLGGRVAVVRSPLRASDLQDEFADRVSEMFEELTHAAQPVTDSRLHWRLADPQVFRWIPGMTAETQALLVASDLANQEITDSDSKGLMHHAATWYQAGRLSSSQWQIVERELTDGGDVFSACVGAHAGEYRAFRWGRVIVDASEKTPRQVYYRELLPPPPTLQAVMAALNEIALANP
jgi:hypothetical protein